MLGQLSIYLGTLLVLLSASFASQAMYIDRAVINFLPGDTQRQDVKVINDKDENLYVKIDVLEVMNPGQDNEKRMPVTNPDAIKLLVTPNRMVVPPKASKYLRIINLDPDNKEEKVYRINVTPVLPPADETKEETKVRLVIAYQVLVLISPDNPSYALDTERNGKVLSMANSGNSYVVLTGGKQCPKADSKAQDCFNIPPKRIYPSNRYDVDLPYDGPAEISLQGVDGIQKKMTL